MIIEKNRQLNIWLALVTFMIVLNFALKPSFIVVQTIALGFIILIYFKFAESVRKFLYYNVLIFAVIDFSMTYTFNVDHDIYFFYIMLFFYYGYVMYKNNFKLPTFDYKNKYNKFLLIFIVYMILSLIISTNRWASFKSMVNYLFMFSFLVMIVKENTREKDINTFFRLSSIFYSVVLILGTLETLGIRYNLRNRYAEMGITVERDPFIRSVPVVFFYNPNNYGMILVIGMIITTLYFLYTHKKREKIYCAVIFIFAEINLIFTTSRTGWISIILALVFGFLVFLFLKEKDKWKKIIAITIVALGMFYVGSLIPSMGVYYGKFENTPLVKKIATANVKSGIATEDIATIGDAGSLNERVTIIYDIVKGVIIKGHVLGFGVGNTFSYLKSSNNTHGIFFPHSLWFEILGDYGVGIFLYAIFIYISLMRDTLACYKLYKSKYYMFSFISLFAFIFLAFAPSTVCDLPTFYLLIGTAVALVKNGKTMNLPQSFSYPSAR